MSRRQTSKESSRSSSARSSHRRLAMATAALAQGSRASAASATSFQAPSGYSLPCRLYVATSQTRRRGRILESLYARGHAFKRRHRIAVRYVQSGWTTS